MKSDANPGDNIYPLLTIDGVKIRGVSDIVPLEYVVSEAQRLLESWWNEDPEMRYSEILCGQNLRVCVRLFQISIDYDEEGEDGSRMLAEKESGNLEEAISLAIEEFREKLSAQSTSTLSSNS